MTVTAPWLELVQSCLETSDIDRRVEILQRINRLLPMDCMIKFPAFITNDYIDRALDLLKERLNSVATRRSMQTIKMKLDDRKHTQSSGTVCRVVTLYFVLQSALLHLFLLFPPLFLSMPRVYPPNSEWFVPLDLGKELKIKCNGSLVDFVSDCTSPANCKSLRLAGNDILECVPDSKMKNTDQHIVFP